MNEPLIAALQANTASLKHHLQVFDDVALNKKIHPDSWTAGEVGEHLLLFDQRVNRILMGEPSAAGRDPQANTAIFTRRLADRENRIDAPVFLLPGDKHYETGSLIKQFDTERMMLTDKIEKMDMNLLYPTAPHRFFGPMTGIEWVQFLILHCERHLLQFDNIARQLAEEDQQINGAV